MKHRAYFKKEKKKNKKRIRSKFSSGSTVSSFFRLFEFQSTGYSYMVRRIFQNVISSRSRQAANPGSFPACVSTDTLIASFIIADALARHPLRLLALRKRASHRVFRRSGQPTIRTDSSSASPRTIANIRITPLCRRSPTESIRRNASSAFAFVRNDSVVGSLSFFFLFSTNAFNI